MREMKVLQGMIEKLKDSEDIEEVREFWMAILKNNVYKSLDAFRSIDLEFQLLVYRDSLPMD